MLTETSISDTAARIAACGATDAVMAARDAACRRREAARGDAEVLLKDIRRLVKRLERQVAPRAWWRRRLPRAILVMAVAAVSLCSGEMVRHRLRPT